VRAVVARAEAQLVCTTADGDCLCRGTSRCMFGTEAYRVLQRVASVVERVAHRSHHARSLEDGDERGRALLARVASPGTYVGLGAASVLAGALGRPLAVFAASKYDRSLRAADQSVLLRPRSSPPPPGSP
jgi:hypothetical protein